MSEEKEFNKYKKRGAYHWEQATRNVYTMNSYVQARYRIVCRLIKKHVACPTAELLDVGCGDGALSGLLARQGYRMYGVDPSIDGIRCANKKFRQNGLQGVFQNIAGYVYPFPEGTFDAVVCSDVIEHVNEPLALLRESRRVLKPGGIMIVSTPIRIQGLPISPYHVQEWTVDEFSSLCQQVYSGTLETCLSHPLLAERAYNLPVKYLQRIVRIPIILLFLVGVNIFDNASMGDFQMQTLVLQKDK